MSFKLPNADKLPLEIRLAFEALRAYFDRRFSIVADDADVVDPIQGQTIYETSTDTLKTYDGSAWNVV